MDYSFLSVDLVALCKRVAVAITADVLREDRAEMLRAGAGDFICKPMDMNRLFEKLRDCFAAEK